MWGQLQDPGCRVEGAGCRHMCRMQIRMQMQVWGPSAHGGAGFGCRWEWGRQLLDASAQRR